VGVTVLCPGFFRSGLFDTARWSNARSQYFGQYMMDRAGATADRVAELAIRAMDCKRLYVVHPWRARLSWRLKRWFPRTFHRLVAAGYRKMIHERAEEEADEESSGDGKPASAEASASEGSGASRHSQAGPC
jgi:short-subunit dehydrogenase